MNAPTVSIVISLCALAISAASFYVSWRNYRRDRAELRIIASMTVFHPGGFGGKDIPALGVDFVNAGRRPISLPSVAVLRVEGPEPDRLAITNMGYYHNRPADGLLNEAQKFALVYPREDWLKILATNKRRCIGVGITDATDTRYYAKLSPRIAAWFNGEEYQETRMDRIKQWRPKKKR